jgi:uncharacterized protein (DUF2461 family)
VIAQVDQFEDKVGTLLGDLVDPVRGLFAEAAFSGRADYDADAGLVVATDLYLGRKFLCSQSLLRALP